MERLRRSQNGAAKHRQLLAAGLSPSQIKTRVARREFHRMHQGVYALGDPSLMPFVTHSAALLSIGRHAVLTDRTAAALWSIAHADPSVIDVTIGPGFAHPRVGVRIHRRQLARADVMTLHNMRITTPARTLIDFAADTSDAELEHALAESRVRRLVTDGKLEQALDRAPKNHAGAARLRALLNTTTGRALTRSQRERLMLSLIAKAQLPKPLVNAKLHGLEVDFYWPEHKLVVEFDGYQTHGTRSAFERDRRRDQILLAHGIRTMRITDRQLQVEPIAVMTRIGQALLQYV